MDMEALYRAVKEHSGLEDDSIVDAGRHGADAGWGGFTYYQDTTTFYRLNEGLIWSLVQENADSFGMTPMELIASFGGAKHVYDGDQLENLLAWFALEEVGRWLEDNPDERTDDDEAGDDDESADLDDEEDDESEEK